MVILEAGGALEEEVVGRIEDLNMPKHFWSEAVHTAVYIMNRISTAAVHGMTPEERFTSKKPDVSHLKVFGCIAYVHVPDELRKKLDPKAEKCIFIGYSLEQKGYRCYNPIRGEFRVSRDVIFYEMSSWYTSSGDALKEDMIMIVMCKQKRKNHKVLVV